MKKLLLATSCLALTSTASMAADLPVAKAPMMAAPAPIFTWTGCYIGGHVGGGAITNTEGAQNGKGGVAGGQGGCNYQDGNWVFGIEGEGYWSGIKSTNASSEIVNIVNNNGPERFTNTLRNKADFTIAGRAGIAFDRTLIYGKGGWAWGSVDQFTFDVCCSATSIPNTTAFSGTLDGLLLGAGIEHALTRNWTIKFEYNYIAFGAKELTRTNCVGTLCGVTGTSSIGMTKQLFKVGANYLFDWGTAPLVAKY